MKAKYMGVTLAIAAVMPFFSAAAVDETAGMLPEVIVTATRTRNTIQNVPQSVQVIDETVIDRNAAGTIRELLETETGLFQASRIRGGGHDVVLRGMNTEHTLILIDGRRMANEAEDGVGNARTLERISPSNVKRIEIIRGPASALYGSEAMGGVINIITRKEEGTGGAAGVSRSSDRSSLWYRFHTNRGRWTASAHVRFDKEFRHKDADVLESDLFGPSQSYNLSLDYALNDRNTLSAFYDTFSQHVRADSDGTLTPLSLTMGPVTVSGKAAMEIDSRYTFSQKNYGLQLDGRSDTNEWQLRIYESKFKGEDGQQQRVLAVLPGKDPLFWRAFEAVIRSQYGASDYNKNENRYMAVEGRDSMRIGSGQRLTFGGEYIRNKVRGTNLGSNGKAIGSVSGYGITKAISEKSVDTYSFYVQDEIERGKWFIIPAARYDHHSSFGRRISPKVGVTYKAGDHVRIKANAGSGFKAPSVSRMYYSMVRQGGGRLVQVLGNPDLEAETSVSWDIGAEGEWGRFFGALTWFDNRVKHLIDYKEIGSSSGRIRTYKFFNVDKARIQGLEATAGFHLSPRWDMKWIAGRLSAKDSTTGKDLTRRACLTSTVQLVYDDHKETGYTAMLWNRLDWRYMTDEYERKTYALTGLSVTRKWQNGSSLFGRIENIFNKKDRDIDLDGRLWLIGMERRF